MIDPHGRVDLRWEGEPFVCRATRNAKLPRPVRSTGALLLDGIQDTAPDGFRAYLSTQGSSDPSRTLISLPENLAYIAEGDILYVSPAAGEVRELLEEARRDAEQTKGQIVAEAKASADAEWARIQRQIETATVQALKELAEASADNAINLAGRIVQAQLSKEDHAALITESIQRFRGSPSEN